MRVLVAAATKYGATAGIAQTIAEVLGEARPGGDGAPAQAGRGGRRCRDHDGEDDRDQDVAGGGQGGDPGREGLGPPAS